jgi:SseB protein N-terminal domain
VRAVLTPPNYSWRVLGISGGDPSFRDDEGSAEPGVTAALEAFAAGQGTEQAALTALAGSRLLVPVVAVMADQRAADERAAGKLGAAEPADQASGSARAEKASEMALPTLIGLDGRRAIPAFTCQASMRSWQAAARPVPAAARQVWQAAIEDSCAVVIDVAGPVPLAVEGARLAALARGEAVPAPYEDPDVHEVVSDVLAGQLDIAAFDLRPGDAERDLIIALTLAPGRAGYEVTGLVTDVGNAVMTRLGGRLRRGVAIWLGGSRPVG